MKYHSTIQKSKCHLPLHTELGIPFLRGGRISENGKFHIFHTGHIFIMLPPINFILVSKDCSFSELSNGILSYYSTPPHICIFNMTTPLKNIHKGGFDIPNIASFLRGVHGLKSRVSKVSEIIQRLRYLHTLFSIQTVFLLQ